MGRQFINNGYQITLKVDSQSVKMWFGEGQGSSWGPLGVHVGPKAPQSEKMVVRLRAPLPLQGPSFGDIFDVFW